MLKLRLALFITAVVAVALISPPILGDVSGSSVTGVTPGAVAPGATLDVSFTVDFVNATGAGGEWMERFEITVPNNWTINSVDETPGNTFCYPNIGGDWGNTGQVLHWSHLLFPNVCGIYTPGVWTFTANVTVASCSAPMLLPWTIYGDTFAEGPPHNVSGSIQVACSATTGAMPVPALSQLGLALFGLLLAGLAFAHRRR